MYDFLIKDGHVLDTALGLDEVADVAIKNDVIAEVGAIENFRATRVIDARGCFVTPGLMDYHAHVNYGSSDICFRAEVGCFPSGVTTVCDGGSCGVPGFENFYNVIIAQSQVTIKTHLNVSSAGETAHSIPEIIDPKYFEEEKILRLCKKYKDNIIGLKLRQGAPMVRECGIKPLRASVKLARQAGLPLTVHMIDSPISPRDTLAELGPGDIYCHVFHNTGQGCILDDKGKVYPEVLEAQKRGVLMDVSHGRGAASFQVIRAALDQGLKPDLITSDLSRYSLFRSPAYTHNYIMSEFLHFGFTFRDLVKMFTETTAKLIYGSADGFIKTGAPADLAILRIVEKPVRFTDYKGEVLDGDRLIKCEMTFKAGEPVFCQMDFN